MEESDIKDKMSKAENKARTAVGKVRTKKAGSEAASNQKKEHPSSSMNQRLTGL